VADVRGFKNAKEQEGLKFGVVHEVKEGDGHREKQGKAGGKAGKSGEKQDGEKQDRRK
jgi:hypothetical protein